VVRRKQSGWTKKSRKNIAEDVFQVDLFLSDVFDLLRTGGFALNGNSPSVAQAMEFGEDLFEVDQPFADKDLFAEFAGVGGPAAVLGVDAADVRAEDIYGVDRVGLAIKDEIGGVEADREVGHSDIAKHAGHGGRGLLAGLHEEMLTIALADACDLPDRFDGLGIERVGRIFRNEAAVGLYLQDAKLLCKAGDLSEGIDARDAGPRRDETNG